MAVYAAMFFMSCGAGLFIWLRKSGEAAALLAGREGNLLTHIARRLRVFNTQRSTWADLAIWWRIEVQLCRKGLLWSWEPEEAETDGKGMEVRKKENSLIKMEVLLIKQLSKPFSDNSVSHHHYAVGHEESNGLKKKPENPSICSLPWFLIIKEMLQTLNYESTTGHECNSLPGKRSTWSLFTRNLLNMTGRQITLHFLTWHYNQDVCSVKWFIETLSVSPIN